MNIAAMEKGTEQGFAFRGTSGEDIDASNSDGQLFKPIADAFPAVEEDGAVFERKPLEKQPKRCGCDRTLITVNEIRRAMMTGFNDAKIASERSSVLIAARKAMPSENGDDFDWLAERLENNRCYAADMKRDYDQHADIMRAISNRYRFLPS